MRYCRYLLVVLVWMAVHVSVFGDTTYSDIIATTAPQPSTNVKVRLLQRLGSYMFNTMDQITHPMRPFYQGVTRVFRSLHPTEFHMNMISLRAANPTTIPTPPPTKNPTMPTPTMVPSMAPSYNPSVPALVSYIVVTFLYL